MDSSITVAVKPSGMNHVGDELSDFVNDASEVYGFDLQHVIAVGYSNGANIAASTLLLRPETLSSAILFRPTIPLVPEVLVTVRSASRIAYLVCSKHLYTSCSRRLFNSMME